MPVVGRRAWLVCMIPPHWIAHRRGRDSEVIGYLRPVGELFEPMNLFGQSLGDPAEYADAENLLEQGGLGYLAEPWQLVDAGGTRRRVRIIEVSANEVLVGNHEFGKVVGYDGNIGDQDRLPVPVPEGRLLPD